MFFIKRIPLDATHFAWLYKPVDATKAAALSRTPSDNPLLDGEAALLSNGAYIYVRTESDDDLGSATLVGVNAVGLVRRTTPAA